jgi:3-phenylpropionate/cinnamic acid dioxygenase small subunit
LFVLQSRTDSLQGIPGLSSETCPTPDYAHDISNIKVEEDKDIKDEIPVDITFSVIKTEEDEVSYVCVFVFRQIYQCSKMPLVFVTSSWLST